MIRLIVAAAFLAAFALAGCGGVNGAPSGAYGGIDAGGDIHR